MARRGKLRKAATSRTTTIDATDADEVENDEAEQPIGDDMARIRRGIMYTHAAAQRGRNPSTRRKARRRSTK